MNKYSIANTTKAERQKVVSDAIAMNSLGADKPLSEEHRALFQSYVDGELDFDELRKLIVDTYLKTGD
ncbi:antitoxin VbhA family protein [Alkalihalobacterium bogoriense]|uniref:antitoxin VbhA family protein n=1 Tax=Alkalihalobacterium bogoriense TaxID=246272 RepID=UPI00047AAE1D|nr:antitoxin VbhA family protein [Alkalihalobacterium bogoriense]